MEKRKKAGQATKKGPGQAWHKYIFYIYKSKLSVCYVCYTMSVTPDYILSIYKNKLYVFFVEGLHMTSEK